MEPVYSRHQLSEFLNHIEIPQKYQLDNDPPRDLNYLTCLHTHMLSTVPYENLTLHYSKTHTITLDPQHLFQKIVTDKRGRGGYCMENSLLYNQILRGLGFHAYTVGVRIRHRTDGVPQGPYIGW
jgi:arylamine N-acetyltransferase